MVRIVERGEVVEGAQITRTTSKDRFAPLDLVLITIILKNLRENVDLVFVAQSSWVDYTFNLVFSNQKPVPRTLFGQRILELSSEITRIVEERLKPGQAVILTIPLNRLFDMTLADTYELSVSRSIEREDDSGFVDIISNRILIEISAAVGENLDPEQVI